MADLKLQRKYAQLAVRVGANVKPGQIIVLQTSIESAEFARMVMEEGYAAGATDVILLYSDMEARRIRMEHTELERLTDIPRWRTEPSVLYGEQGACFIHIVGEDPDAFAGLDQNKVGQVVNAEKIARRPFYELIDREENQWTVVAAPTSKWAQKMFPNVGADEAVEKLWDAIFTAMRLYTPDPVAAWKEHCTNLQNHCKRLNTSGIRTLHMQNSLGTNLTLELAEDNLWMGGIDTLVDGWVFQANMPTEEVYTMPHKDRVNGRVVSSMPLNYQGTLIDGFSFTFRDGVVVEYDAKTGKEALDLMLSADEGCKRLGEVALVPYDSPIRATGLLFYETLFDENAACHLALGSAYPSNMKNSQELTREQRAAKGCNESASHVDFMFGTADLSITGILADGTQVPVFVNGGWV